MNAVRGGSVVSPTGFAHLVGHVGAGMFTTVCGVQVGSWSGWGRPSKRLEAYRACSKCSIHGPKVVEDVR